MEGPAKRRNRRAVQHDGAPSGLKKPASWSTAASLPQTLRALIAIAESGPGQLGRQVLEALGFMVEIVDSGIGAVIAVRERTPKLILMDLQLRDVPGREAISWLRSNRNIQAIPIVILAGASDEERLLQAPCPGAILRKPLSPEAIRRVIRDVLETEDTPCSP